MPLERFDDDLNIIAGLGDDPKRDDGLSTPQFKSVFDKAGLLIQKFINDKLIPFIEKQNVGLPLGGGTMEGPINMNGQILSGLNAPTENDHAANMGFVNEAVKEAAPYNYAHNSDFTHFIAQHGLCKSHAGSVAIYAGDRWILDSGTVTGDAIEGGNGYTNITLNGTIRQIVENAPDVGTAAIEMVSGTAEIYYANGEITITSNGGVIRNVRLFKGNWNADNMAAYQPKGYSVELAECQRCFQYFNIKNMSMSGPITGGGTEFSDTFYFVVPMRTIPTLTVKSVGATIRVYNGYSSLTNSGSAIVTPIMTMNDVTTIFGRLTLEFASTVGVSNGVIAVNLRNTEFELSADFPED